MESWKPTRCCGINSISVDTDTLYKRPFSSECISVVDQIRIEIGQISVERVLANHLLWVLITIDCKGVISKSNHPIQSPVTFSHDLGTNWKCVFIFRPLLLYPRGKNPRYTLGRRLCGPQNRSGGRGEENNLALTGTQTPTPRPPALR
jgi:hypothetical protein